MVPPATPYGKTIPPQTAENYLYPHTILAVIQPRGFEEQGAGVGLGGLHRHLVTSSEDALLDVAGGARRPGLLHRQPHVLDFRLAARVGEATVLEQ